MLTAISPLSNYLDSLIELTYSWTRPGVAYCQPGEVISVSRLWIDLSFAPVQHVLSAIARLDDSDISEKADDANGGNTEATPATATAPTELKPRSKRSKKPTAKPELRQTNFAAGEHLHPRERTTLEVLQIIHELNWLGLGDEFAADEDAEIGPWFVGADHYNSILELRHIESGDRWLRYLPVSSDSHYEFQQFCKGIKAAIRSWNTLHQIEIEFPQSTPAPQPEPTSETPLFELKRLSDKVAYFVRTDSGEIVCCYAGFSNKRVAKNWGDELLGFPQVRFELRESKRLKPWKWELKIKGLSLRQIQKLAEQDLTKPREKQCAGGRLDKNEPTHPLSDAEIIEQGERAKADLFPPAAPQPAPQQPKYGELYRHIESGFVGTVTASTSKGGILKDANGDNKWVIWAECQPEESLAIGF